MFITVSMWPLILLGMVYVISKKITISCSQGYTDFPSTKWATKPWIEAVIAANEYGRQTGFQLDIAPGPSWPASSPDVQPDDEASAKEVVTGRIVVGNGTEYSGDIPPPYSEPEPGVFNQTLLALQAWRVNNASSAAIPTVVLDAETLIDLTKSVIKGQIRWTPPDNATWILLSYYMRGTAQRPEAVCSFSNLLTQAISTYLRDFRDHTQTQKEL